MSAAILYDSRRPQTSPRFGAGLEPWELFEAPDGYADDFCGDCQSFHEAIDLTSPLISFSPYHPTRRPLACVVLGVDWAEHCGIDAGYAGEPWDVPAEFDRDENLRYAWLKGHGVGRGYRDDRAAFERDRERVLDRAGR